MSNYIKRARQLASIRTGEMDTWREQYDFSVRLHEPSFSTHPEIKEHRITLTSVTLFKCVDSEFDRAYQHALYHLHNQVYMEVNRFLVEMTTAVCERDSNKCFELIDVLRKELRPDV